MALCLGAQGQDALVHAVQLLQLARGQSLHLRILLQNCLQQLRVPEAQLAARVPQLPLGLPGQLQACSAQDTGGQRGDIVHPTLRVHDGGILAMLVQRPSLVRRWVWYDEILHRFPGMVLADPGVQ